VSATALSVVLFAAFLHAVWNAMVKSTTDRALVIGAVSFTHALFGLVLICVSPAPLAVSWPYILASTIIHYGYYFLMFQAYRLGDLSQVYPISRGLAPVLVALGAYLAIGESLSPAALLGLGAVSFGIMLLAFNGQGRGSDPRAGGGRRKWRADRLLLGRRRHRHPALGEPLRLYGLAVPA
jgi:drug/metabolite transporter (DMT)-like permease